MGWYTSARDLHDGGIRAEIKRNDSSVRARVVHPDEIWRVFRKLFLDGTLDSFQKNDDGKYAPIMREFWSTSPEVVFSQSSRLTSESIEFAFTGNICLRRGLPRN